MLFYASGPTLYLQGTPGNDNLTFDVLRYKNPTLYTYVIDFQGQLYDTTTFGDIVLNTLGGNDHVTVNGLMDHALTINLGNGNDTVQVNYGDPEAGYTGGIFGDTPVTVNGGGGVDALVYNSQEPYVYNIYNVGGSSISNAAFDIDGTVSPPLDVLSYAGIQNLTVFTSPNTAPPNYGPNADFVNVQSSDSTLTTVSVPPSRNANFNVAGGVSGPVYCYGGNGTNTFTVDAGVAADVGVTGGTGSSTLNVTGGPSGQTIRVAAGAVGVGRTPSPTATSGP